MLPAGNYTIENFKIHDKKNPHIWDAFERYALIMTKHRDFYSAKAVFHRVRWDTAIGEIPMPENDQGEFKISDGWISHYARKFLESHPEHEGFFRTQNRRVSYFNP